MKSCVTHLLAALTVAALAAAAQTAGHDHTAAGGKVLMLSKDLEMRLAVDALPAHLRPGATVKLLTADGYVTQRTGSNPFTCIVSRRGGNFYPVCFDEEGTRTILPAFMDDATLRLKGMPDEEVARKMAEGFESGKYRPPARSGVAYMLSSATYMLMGGKLRRVPAHTMFYAPYLTDAEIGGVPGKSAFMDRPGPHGMIILPAGPKEREAMLLESKALVDEVERAIGLQ